MNTRKIATRIIMLTTMVCIGASSATTEATPAGAEWLTNPTPDSRSTSPLNPNLPIIPVVEASVCDEDGEIIVHGFRHYLVRPDRYLLLTDQRLKVGLAFKTRVPLHFRTGLEPMLIELFIDGDPEGAVETSEGKASFMIRRSSAIAYELLTFAFTPIVAPQLEDGDDVASDKVPTIPDLDVEPLPNCPPDEYKLVDDPDA
ncbi:MAG: hypothetical protein HC927_13770 [Deltaproteobacteria bacterium]|nr:hypothetical protein [Deltaproteobacteria bacterium]